MRLLRLLSALVGALFTLAVLAAATVGYLAATGRSMEALRAITLRAGGIFAGQQTEHIKIDVRLRPVEREVSVTATVRVRSDVASRRRLYFLLNDALRLRAASVENDPGAQVYRIGPVIAVDLGAPLAEGDNASIVFDYAGNPTSSLLGLGAAEMEASDVQLGADDLWIPLDLQGQFTADVTVTLPASLTVVHAGDEQESARFGSLQRLRWVTPRPVAAFALVAGNYKLTDVYRDDTRYRLFLAEDVDLNGAEIVQSMVEANRTLSERYGPSGFPTLAMYVTRNLRRGYNDGAGVIGLSIRYFRRGDYGFALIAHEIAHNWWGATVMERWLQPGTGGEWLVEGFAEMSSLLATEVRYGQDALVRRLAQEAFDPRRSRPVSEMSVLDNALDERMARDTIYNKGAYVAYMLRRRLGDEAFFAGLRAFIEGHRGHPVGDVDLQTTLQETTGVDLADFFNEWVRSPHLLDLAIDRGAASDSVALSNLGDNPVAGDADVWILADGQPPQTRSLPVDAQLEIGSGPATVIADPALAWADMWRGNNRNPRKQYPLWFSSSNNGVRVTTRTTAYPWAASELRVVEPNDVVRGNWELAATPLYPPLWLDDYTMLLSLDDGKSQPSIETLDTRNGQRHPIGRGIDATAVAETIYAARGDRLLRWSGPSWREETVVRVRGDIERPAVSVDGQQLAYAVARGNQLEVRVRPVAGGEEQVLFAWDRDLRALRWAPDGEHLYAVIGGDWDWQVWDVRADGTGMRTLVREAAAISDLAVAPNGKQLAVAAAPTLDYPHNRREVIVLDLELARAKRFDVPESDAARVTWTDDDTIVAVVDPSGSGTPWYVPEERRLVRIKVGEGSVEDLGGS